MKIMSKFNLVILMSLLFIIYFSLHSFANEENILPTLKSKLEGREKGHEPRGEVLFVPKNHQMGKTGHGEPSSIIQNMDWRASSYPEDVKINWPEYTFKSGEDRPPEDKQLAKGSQINMELPTPWVWACSNAFYPTTPTINASDSYKGNSKVTWENPNVDPIASIFFIAGVVDEVDEKDPDYSFKINFEANSESVKQFDEQTKNKANTELISISDNFFTRKIALGLKEGSSIAIGVGGFLEEEQNTSNRKFSSEGNEFKNEEQNPIVAFGIGFFTEDGENAENINKDVRNMEKEKGDEPEEKSLNSDISEEMSSDESNRNSNDFSIDSMINEIFELISKIFKDMGV